MQDRNTEYVTQGDVQGTVCAAMLTAQAYHISYGKGGNFFFLNPNLVSGFVRKDLFDVSF